MPTGPDELHYGAALGRIVPDFEVQGPSIKEGEHERDRGGKFVFPDGEPVRMAKRIENRGHVAEPVEQPTVYLEPCDLGGRQRGHLLSAEEVMSEPLAHEREPHKHAGVDRDAPP